MKVVEGQGCLRIRKAADMYMRLCRLIAEILQFWSPSCACHPIIIQEASQLFRFLSKVDKA